MARSAITAARALPPDLRQTFRRAVSVGIFGVLPLLVLLLAIRTAVEDDIVAVDFTHAFLPAAEDVLGGRSPYGESGVLSYVYTPSVAWLVTPFTLVPLEVAQGLVSVLLLAALPASLWLLGARDWRVVGWLVPGFGAIEPKHEALMLAVLAVAGWLAMRSTVQEARADSS